MADLPDLEALWKEQMARASLKWEDEKFRYERTQLPPLSFRTGNYAEELVEQLALSPGDTVLDIGCGDGAIAVRVAKRVRQVTALDADPNLLFPVTQRAVAEGITNLSFLNLDWREARIGPDIPVHDIVLASRFRQITDLRGFLEKMNAAAIDKCYLTWIAEREEMDARICQILGREYHPLPDYSIIPKVLHDLGIEARVDFFSTRSTHRFESEEAAIEEAARGYEVQTFSQQERLSSLVRSGLEYREGYWWRDIDARWALIWWQK
ncbi:MAG: methyltransferase domain-containing protein [Dehalococcoidia bacterium]